MDTRSTQSGCDLEDALPSERARLVRLCTRLTGDANAAEDLAQETLIEAWRHLDRLNNPAGYSMWLSAIARNVCLMWARKRAREGAILVERLSAEGSSPLRLDDWAADEFDLEVELERKELADLLDQAMSMLPPETRDVLISRYVEESPHAETAARLGLNEATVAKRLERGKLALRRVLTTQLRDQVLPYGLTRPDTDILQETRIWCSGCGRRRLIGRFTKDESGGEFVLRCPGCHGEPGVYHSNARLENAELARLLRGIKGYRAALFKGMGWADEYLRSLIARGTAPCISCGRAVRLGSGMGPDPPPSIQALRGIYVRCDACGDTVSQNLGGLALMLPQGRSFWREHPRIRLLPEREIEVQGCPAIVTTFESVGDSTRLDVITVRDTFELIGVHGSSTPNDTR